MSAAVPAWTVALLLSACAILVQGPGAAVVATLVNIFGLYPVRMTPG